MEMEMAMAMVTERGRGGGEKKEGRGERKETPVTTGVAVAGPTHGGSHPTSRREGSLCV